MSMEQDQNEKLPEGYRHLTQAEFNRLALALSKLSKPKRELTEAERQKLERFWRRHNPTGVFEEDDQWNWNQKFLEAAAELAQLRSDIREIRVKSFLKGVLIVLIPLMLYGIGSGANHW